ncbi:ComF family protein, partial [Microbacterium ulmi]|nr:ComF family protein [Microbacterium ulmi]
MRDSSSTVVRRALADALALVLPVECAGCGIPDASLCETCARGLEPHVSRRDLGGGLAVWSGLSFDASRARVVRTLKEDGRTGLARALAPALRAAVAEAVRGDAARAGALARTD